MGGFLGPVGFSLMEGLNGALSESREVSGGGKGLGTAFSIVFVESASGGASSESEGPQSSGTTEGGGWAGNEGCRDEESGAVRMGVVETFDVTAPFRPPRGPCFLLRPRPLPGPLFGP